MHIDFLQEMQHCSRLRNEPEESRHALTLAEVALLNQKLGSQLWLRYLFFQQKWGVERKIKYTILIFFKKK